MQLASAPLGSFLTALDLSPVATETPHRLSISEKVRGQAVKDLDYDVVERLAGAYGESLTAVLLLQDLPEFTIDAGITPQVFQDAKAGLLAENSYQLCLRIDKHALLEAVLGLENARGSVHYFFATSVESLLALGLEKVEQDIWGNATEARRLLVGDTELRRSGPAFQIVGGISLTSALNALPSLPRLPQMMGTRFRGIGL